MSVKDFGIGADTTINISANDSYILMDTTRLTAVILSLNFQYVNLSAVAQLTGIVTSAEYGPVMQHYSRLLSKSADNESSPPSTIVISSLITPSATCARMTVCYQENITFNPNLLPYSRLLLLSSDNRLFCLLRPCRQLSLPPKPHAGLHITLAYSTTHLRHPGSISDAQ